MSRKRRRFASPRARRPIDKTILAVNHTIDDSQTNSRILLADVPLTVTGIRWNFSVRTNTNVGPPDATWAIVFVRDGNIPNTITSADLVTLYAPEQNVLAWGIVRMQASGSSAGPLSMMVEGKTKTMRKMMSGDALFFLTIGSQNEGILLCGGIQYFTKL